MKTTYCVVRIELKGHVATSKKQAQVLADKANKRISNRKSSPDNPTCYKVMSTASANKLF